MGGLNVANGLLSKRLTVLASTRTRTPTGGWTDDYQSVGTVAGAVTTPRRTALMEKIMGEQPTNELLAEITLRETIAIDTSMRIQDGSDVYEIVGMQRQTGVCILIGRRVV